MRLRLIAIAGLAALAALGFATPAFAHDALESSTPEAGSVVAEAPERISLTVTGQPGETGTAIIVRDTNGTDWSTGEVSIDDHVVTKALRPSMPAGVYTVQWRVVSEDFHPISSTFVFGIGDSDQIRDEVAIAAAAVGGETAPSGDATAATDGGAATVTSASSTSNNEGLLIALGVGAAGLLVAGALTVGALNIVRRKHHVNESSKESNES